MHAATLPSPTPAAARRYSVRYQRDLRGTGLDWRLYAYGPGHWCVANGHAGSFRSETEAHSEGRRWVSEGRA